MKMGGLEGVVLDEEKGSSPNSHEVWSAPGPDNVRLGCHMLCVITFPHQTPAALALVTPPSPIFTFATDEASSVRAHPCFL